MHKRFFIFSLMLIVLVGILVPGKSAAIAPDSSSDILIQASESNITCSNPGIVNADACHQMEELILKSTVRISIETWVVKADESGYITNSLISHATIKDGHCLVTHNHFNVPLSIRPHDGEFEAYQVVTLFNYKGESFFKAPLSDFELVWEGPQMLVLSYKKDDELFDKLGFVSAKFKDWQSVPLATDMEIAQVDWDGTTTRVDWTVIQEIDIEDDVSRLVLADDAKVGASGGGIFWQGANIANNWFRRQNYDKLAYHLTRSQWRL